MRSPLSSGRGVSEAVQAGQRVAPVSRPSRLLVVASGKGGTGKSFLAANLAIQWSLWGRKVVLVDGDLGLANLHVLLGLTPKQHLLGLLEGRSRRPSSADDLLLEGPAGVRLLPGGSGIRRLAALNRGELRRLFQRLQRPLEGADAVIIDLSSGLSAATLLFLQAAQEIILVANPDPSALLDAYAVLKVLSRLESTGQVHLIMNRGRDTVAAWNCTRRFQTTARDYLKQDLYLLGRVPEDETVSLALSRRHPLLLLCPEAAAATALREAARKLLEHPGPGAGVESFFSRSAALLAPRRRMAG
ncbi:MAG: P-loop NTPase [Acidobacteriota bacterium]